jgi:hypothetical protein
MLGERLQVQLVERQARMSMTEAADWGQAIAHDNLGVTCSTKGEGVAQGKSEAVRLYRLGIMFSKSNGVRTAAMRHEAAIAALRDLGA